jgi:hypothetical protein
MSNNSSAIVSPSVATETCLQRHYLAMDSSVSTLPVFRFLVTILFTVPISSSPVLLSLFYPALQSSLASSSSAAAENYRIVQSLSTLKTRASNALCRQLYGRYFRYK